MYFAGQRIYRASISAATQSIALPIIDFAHLHEIAVSPRGGISGFHILPAGIAVTPRAVLVLPPHAVPVFDSAGNNVTASASVTLRFLPVCTTDGDNMVIARVDVEYTDSSGVVQRAGAREKDFWPRSWSHADITQAIYQAFANAYAGFQSVPGQVRGTTHKGVVVEERVNGSAARLNSIRTAYLLYPGRALTGADKP